MTVSDKNFEESLLLRLHELSTAVHHQTERIDSVSGCLTSVTESMERILETHKGQRSSSVLETRTDADFDQLFKASVHPILAQLEDLSSLMVKANARNEFKSSEGNADAWSNASTALSLQSESVHLKLREYFTGSPGDSVENSTLWTHMRAYLADLKQELVKDIREQLDEHLSATKLFAKLTETPCDAPAKAMKSARLCHPKNGMASPQLTPQGPKVFPAMPMTPNTSIDDSPSQLKTFLAQESDTQDPNCDFLQKDKSELPQGAKSKLSMRVADDSDDDRAVQLKLNTAMATIFTHEDNVTVVPFDPVDFYKKYGRAQAIGRSESFHRVTDMMIVLQAIYLGVESEYNIHANLYESHWSFQIAAHLFIVYFIAELLIRFLAYEHRRECLRDGWFKFDVLLVSTMILDAWIVQLVSWACGRTHTRFHIQSLRALRLIKIVRIAKLVEAFPELNLMTKALVGSIRAISSTMFLVSLMLFALGIFMHMLLRDLGDLNQQMAKDYSFSFTTLPDCFWTLLVCGVLQLDNTSLIMTTLIYGKSFEEKVAGVAFTVFSLTASLLVLQMLIGVLCDVIARIGQEQRDADAVALVRQEVLGDLYELDAGDGTISQEGLQQVMNGPNSRALLKKLKINRLFFCELANMLYVTPGKNVSIQVIMELLILCRGENTTNVDILSSAFCFLTNELVEMENRMVSELLQLNHGRRPSAIADAANLCVGRSLSL